MFSRAFSRVHNYLETILFSGIPYKFHNHVWCWSHIWAQCFDRNYSCAGEERVKQHLMDLFIFRLRLFLLVQLIPNRIIPALFFCLTSKATMSQFAMVKNVAQWDIYDSNIQIYYIAFQLLSGDANIVWYNYSLGLSHLTLYLGNLCV